MDCRSRSTWPSGSKQHHRNYRNQFATSTFQSRDGYYGSDYDRPSLRHRFINEPTLVASRSRLVRNHGFFQCEVVFRSSGAKVIAVATGCFDGGWIASEPTDHKAVELDKIVESIGGDSQLGLECCDRCVREPESLSTSSGICHRGGHIGNIHRCP